MSQDSLWPSLCDLDAALSALITECQVHVLRQAVVDGDCTLDDELRNDVLRPHILHAERGGFAIVGWFQDLWAKALHCQLLVDRSLCMVLRCDFLTLSRMTEADRAEKLQVLESRNPGLGAAIWRSIKTDFPGIAVELRRRLSPPASEPAATGLEDRLQSVLRVVVGKKLTGGCSRLLEIASSKARVEDKLVAMDKTGLLRPDVSATELADLLSVTPAAVKKSGWWKRRQANRRQAAVDDLAARRAKYRR